ncbi:hypothetical protein FQR65_LT07644 [Abscondita terminalis]|nr:hypothetical protein FQR65_LT07644 [Abscondita terminalis]
MKYISFLLLTAVISFAKKVPDEILRQWHAETAYYHSICICESGVNPVLANRVFLYQEFIDDPCLTCYLRCIARNMGLLNSLDEALPHIWNQQTANVTYELATICVNQTSMVQDPCKKVLLLALCFCDHLGQ